jgi:hypothetical protein
MNPYSHLVLAHRLQSEIRPANLPDYYWGTVAADTRYTARIPRARTHLTPKKILSFGKRYPELESFMQGYLIHCLADEVELWALLERHWYLRPFIRHLPLKLTPVMMESYFVERNPVSVSISGTYNPMLKAMGVPEKACHTWAELVTNLAENPSFDSVLHLFSTLGKGRPKLQQYIRLTQKVSRIPLAKNILYQLTKPQRLLDNVETFIRAQPEYRQMIDKRYCQTNSGKIRRQASTSRHNP